MNGRDGLIAMLVFVNSAALDYWRAKLYNVF